MSDSKRAYREQVSLPHTGGLEATIEVFCDPEPPAKGDGIQAEVHITLPVDPGGSFIHPHLQFDQRVWLAQDPLRGSWGKQFEEGRYSILDCNPDSDSDFCLRRPTYKQAFDDATALARAELDKLTAALEERHQATLNH